MVERNSERNEAERQVKPVGLDVNNGFIKIVSPVRGERFRVTFEFNGFFELPPMNQKANKCRHEQIPMWRSDQSQWNPVKPNRIPHPKINKNRT